MRTLVIGSMLVIPHSDSKLNLLSTLSDSSNDVRMIIPIPMKNPKEHPLEIAVIGM